MKTKDDDLKKKIRLYYDILFPTDTKCREDGFFGIDKKSITKQFESDWNHHIKTKGKNTLINQCFIMMRPNDHVRISG